MRKKCPKAKRSIRLTMSWTRICQSWRHDLIFVEFTMRQVWGEASADTRAGKDASARLAKTFNNSFIAGSMNR